ncbi:MAG: filamentous hemagglutinin N-terminal domain-containing protein, partial [Gammaproteobacteria bacterium]|nr:filamentous hemagglutinin N-terminal domain-containing protein [Gammaproteobacteria bacterium]
MPTLKYSGRRLPALAAVLIVWTGVIYADVAFDGTMGRSGALAGPGFTIDAVDGRTEGTNLFHSFNEFNLTSSQSATFTNTTPAAISNVLGRITDINPSSIDGAIKSTIPNANLFLMNPNGFMFGPNATLDVQGAFHATTADYIGLADGTRFNAIPSGADTLLTTAAPAAFGFLVNNPNPITIDQSVLAVPSDETLSLIGGDIAIVGDGLFGTDTLQAPGGLINIASVASTGEVIPNAVGEAPDLQVNTFAHLGTIHVSGAAIINAGGDGGGTVIIRGGRLEVDNSLVVASNKGPVGIPFVGDFGAGIDIHVSGAVVLDNGAEIGTNVFGNVTADSGGVRVKAESLEISNGAFVGHAVFPGATGNTGDIEVDTYSVLLQSGGRLVNNTVGFGESGSIIVNTESLELRDGGLIFTQAFGGPESGDSGDIIVDAGNVLLSNTSVVGPFTSITTQTFSGTGQGGSVRITADSLQILGGGFTEISASTFGAGDAGNVDVTVKGALFMSGSSANPFGTGIFANTFGTGEAGDIGLAAGNLIMIDHTNVGANTFGPGGAGNLSVNTGHLELREGSFFGASALFGTGAGGTMVVTAGDVLISGVSTSLDPFGLDFTGFSTATNVGPGGNMRVTADSLKVANKGSITSISIGAGAAGDIFIELNDVPMLVTGGSTVNSSAFASGSGGNINISAGEVTVSGAGQFNGPNEVGASSIASQAGSTGNAGNVAITAGRLQVLDGATVATNTQGSGQGGNIEVNAEAVLVSGLNQELQENLSAAGLNPEFARSAIRTGSNQSFSGSTSSGDAGNVQIVADSLKLRDHALITSATQTVGDGGNIELTATNASISGDSTISASTIGDGDGGTIALTGNLVEILSGGSVTADSEGAG